MGDSPSTETTEQLGFNNKNVLNGRAIMYVFTLLVVLEIAKLGTGAILAVTALVLALSVLALLTQGPR